MSLGPGDVPGQRRGFPRVSGDKPDLTEIIEGADPFSPREWG